MGADAKTAMKVDMTESAARRIAKIVAAEPGKTALRVSVEGGGCSGFSYKFDLVDSANDDDIAIVKAEEVRIGFDVIGDVTSKLYRYTIFCGPTRPVLYRRYCWHVPSRPDTAAMNAGAQRLLGENDFKSFASAADSRTDSVRTIFRCDVTEARKDDGHWVYVEVEGDGFLYNMVRNIVGSLMEVGLGRWDPLRISRVLAARDRTAAGPIAPPNGLCLMWIKY